MRRRLLKVLKRTAIATGLYPPARWLARRLRAVERHAFEQDVALFRSLLPPGALCFDVGAHVGSRSEAMLAAGAAVVAFEPNPLVLPELRARCAHRRTWRLVTSAVGSRAGRGTLHARKFPGLSSMSDQWPGYVLATFDVPVITLDAAIHAYGAPFYCKIDVEGWELEVLRGLTQPIPLVSFEFHLDDRDLAKAAECLERLAQFGPSRVNLTHGEGSTFLLPEWLPLHQFRAWFPGDLARTLTRQPYGDIFVRDNTQPP